MTNFIYDATGLPFPKTNKTPIPIGEDATKWVAAVDWNAICQALTDVQTFCRGARWIGITKQVSDPVPAGVSDYLWMRTSDGALVHNASTVISGDTTAIQRTLLALVEIVNRTGGLNVNSYVTGDGVSGAVINNLDAALLTTTFINAPGGGGPATNGTASPGSGDAPVYFLPTGAGTTLTGIDNGSWPSGGGKALIFNTSMDNGLGLGAPLTITNEDALSVAANRFTLPGGVSLVLTPGQGVMLAYDSGTSRWKVWS